MKLKTCLLTFMLVALCCPLIGSAQDLNSVENIVILLDTSGSMDNDMPGSNMTRMSAAKTAILESLKYMNPNVHIGLIGFSKHWIFPLGPRDDDVFRESLMNTRYGGNTPLGVYMKVAADELLAARERNHNYGSYRLIIVTDGAANDARKVDIFTSEILSRGITIDAIGVAMSSEHTLATKVNSYRNAGDLDSLSKAMKDILSEASVNDSSVFEGSGFDGLSGMSGDAALAIITALSNPGNHAIGTEPRQVVSGAKNVSGNNASSSSSPATDEGSGIGFILFVVLCIVAIIAFFIVIMKA